MMLLSLQISYQVDEEHLTRKKALHVLKVALEKMPLSASNDDCHSRDDGSKNKSMKANGDNKNEKKVAIHHTTKRDRWADIEAKSLGVGVVNKGQDKFTDCWQRWEAFILLYEMLEEYGTHLVEAAWTHQVSFVNLLM
jgi:tRNA guanosine-2'-O-methyltransferase